jgi:CxxC-x17-CxxC domain-containing protein
MVISFYRQRPARVDGSPVADVIGLLVVAVGPEVGSLVYADRTISCVDCGQEFTFTSGEQEFYAQRGFSEAPKRCTSCRAARKAQRTGSGSGSYGGGSGGYSGGYDRGDGGYGERRPRQMYSAVCAECGRTAMVPFQPTGARPVYCSDCFQNRR